MDVLDFELGLLLVMHSIAKAVGVAALLCPSVLAIAVPSEPLGRRTPEVPWKKSGVSDTWRQKRHDNFVDRPIGKRTNNVNSPSSRDCWDGHYNIDTDMDLEWPDTGKTVNVSTQKYTRWIVTNRSEISTTLRFPT